MTIEFLYVRSIKGGKTTIDKSVTLCHSKTLHHSNHVKVQLNPDHCSKFCNTYQKQKHGLENNPEYPSHKRKKTVPPTNELQLCLNNSNNNSSYKQYT